MLSVEVEGSRCGELELPRFVVRAARQNEFLITMLLDISVSLSCFSRFRNICIKLLHSLRLCFWCARMYQRDLAVCIRVMYSHLMSAIDMRTCDLHASSLCPKYQVSRD